MPEYGYCPSLSYYGWGIPYIPTDNFRALILKINPFIYSYEPIKITMTKITFYVVLGKTLVRPYGAPSNVPV